MGGTEPGALDPPMTKVLLDAPELLDEVNALFEQIAASDAQALVVTRVQRVVNTLVWRRYMRRLEEMQQRQPIQTEHVCESLLTGHLEAITGSVPLFRDGACQERLLFMSAPISNDKRNHVVRLGFDTRFHPATTSQGHGIWLSDDPLQACELGKETDSLPKQGSLMVARALLGRQFICPAVKDNALEPPRLPKATKDAVGGDMTRFDSVVATPVGQHHHVVIYDNSQLYPEFVLQYEIRSRTD